MMNVIVCEDNPIQRCLYEDIIKKHIMIEELDMGIALVTSDPSEVLRYLDNHDHSRSIYFLDIDLNHQLTGMELAVEIRKKDSLGKIIFITTHDECAPLTYRYKVEALDFIEKGNFERTTCRIKESLTFIAEQQGLNIREKEQVLIKKGTVQQYIDFDDILFFETTGRAHRLYVHTKTGKIEFYGKIKEMEKHGDVFLRVHKSYVVNRKNIKIVDSQRYELEMINGQRCAIAAKKLKLLKS